jgi:transcriptional regulator GlxA family with amidase domain
MGLAEVRGARIGAAGAGAWCMALTGLPLAGYTATVTGRVVPCAPHTWPELNAVTLIAYVCNFGAGPTCQGARVE